jgi:hypothetical protein
MMFGSPEAHLRKQAIVDRLVFADDYVQRKNVSTCSQRAARAWKAGLGLRFVLPEVEGHRPAKQGSPMHYVNRFKKALGVKTGGSVFSSW